MHDDGGGSAASAAANVVAAPLVAHIACVRGLVWALPTGTSEQRLTSLGSVAPAPLKPSVVVWPASAHTFNPLACGLTEARLRSMARHTLYRHQRCQW